MRNRLLSVWFLFCSALFTLEGQFAFAGSPASDIPPLRAFFPLSPELAAQMRRPPINLDAETLPAGIYFSNPRITRYQVDVGRNMEHPTYFDASYLVGDKQLHLLFGEARWKKRGTRRFDTTTSPPTLDQNFSEFRWKYGWVPAVREDGIPVRQLWVVAPSGAQWLLYEKGYNRDNWTRFFAEIPNLLVPVSNGVFLVAQDHNATLLSNGGDSTTSFTLKDWDLKEVPEVSIVAAQRELSLSFGESRYLPLAAYDEDTHFIALAGWHYPTGTPPPQHAPLSDQSTSNIYLLDVVKKTADFVLKDKAGIFALEMEGIFTSPLDPLVHGLDLIGISWAKKSLARKRTPISLEGGYLPDYTARDFFAKTQEEGRPKRIRFNSSGGRTVVAWTPVSTLTKEDLYALELAGVRSDLLNRVRTGEASTFWDSPEFAMELAATLGAETIRDQPKRGLVALVYENGEEPTNMLAGYFQSLDENYFDAPPALKGLTHVFQFPSTFAELDTRLTQINKSTTGKHTMLLFEDYPASSVVADTYDGKTPAASLHESLKGHAQRLNNFKTQFAMCAQEGTCVVALTIRKEIWNALARRHPQSISHITPIKLPSPESFQQRRNVARALLLRTAMSQGLTVTEPTFQSAFALLEGERPASVERGENTVHFYKTFFSGLVKHAATAPNKEIRISHVRDHLRFTNGEYGHWKINVETVPVEIQGEKQLVEMPLWLSPDGSTREVLSRPDRQLWKQQGWKLAKADQYSHAVFQSQANGIGGNGILLVRPDADPHWILKDVRVDHVQLHPEGLYVVYEEGDALKLFFYQMNPAFSRTTRERKPGSVRLLADDLSLGDFAADRMRFEYLNGKLHIQVLLPAESGKSRVNKLKEDRVFSPLGEEVSNVP